MLSPREEEVLVLMAESMTNEAIGQQLGISAETVKRHASSTFRKLKVPNRIAAVRWAIRTGRLNHKARAARFASPADAPVAGMTQVSRAPR